MQLGCIHILVESDRGESLWLVPEWDERHQLWCVMRAASRAYFAMRGAKRDESKRLSLRLNGVDVSTKRFVERVEDCAREISVRLLNRYDRFEVASVDRHQSLAQLGARFFHHHHGEEFVNERFSVSRVRLKARVDDDDDDEDMFHRAPSAETVLLLFRPGNDNEARLTVFSALTGQRISGLVAGGQLYVISPYTYYTVTASEPLEFTLLRIPLAPDHGRRQRLRDEPPVWVIDTEKHPPPDEKIVLPLRYDNARLTLQTMAPHAYEVAQCDSPAHCVIALDVMDAGLTLTTADSNESAMRRFDLCTVMTRGEPYMLENTTAFAATVMILMIDPFCQ